jgi:WD40 repeat protein
VFVVRAGKKQKVFAPTKRDKYFVSFALSPDGRTMGLGDSEGVSLIDVRSSTVQGILKTRPNNAQNIAISPDGSFLAAGGLGGSIHVWSLSDRKEIAEFVGHSGVIRKVIFDPSSKRLASTSNDKTMRIWDIAKKTALKCFVHPNTVSSVAFSPDGSTAVTAAGPLITQWDLKEGKKRVVDIGK